PALEEVRAAVGRAASGAGRRRHHAVILQHAAREGPIAARRASHAHPKGDSVETGPLRKRRQTNRAAIGILERTCSLLPDTWPPRGRNSVLSSSLGGGEDGTLPHAGALDDGRVDEEGRLMYVDITQTKELPARSWCAQTKRYGDIHRNQPSRFPHELPQTDLH